MTSDFNRLITIKNRNTTKSETLGYLKDDWEVFKEVYAKVDYQGGDMQYDEISASSYSNITFTIRWISGLNYESIIVYDGQDCIINHIRTLGRAKALEISTTVYENNTPLEADD